MFIRTCALLDTHNRVTPFPQPFPSESLFVSRRNRQISDMTFLGYFYFLIKLGTGFSILLFFFPKETYLGFFYLHYCFIVLFLRFHIFIWQGQWEREHNKGSGRAKQAFHHAGSPMWGWIPGSWDHEMSRSRCLMTERPRCPIFKVFLYHLFLF